MHDILFQTPLSRMDIYSRFWLACFCIVVWSNSGFKQSEATIYTLATQRDLKQDIVH